MRKSFVRIYADDDIVFVPSMVSAKIREVTLQQIGARADIMQQQTNPYPGEKDSLLWDIDQMKVSISFTDHQKLSFQAYINGIHISFWKKIPWY